MTTSATFVNGMKFPPEYYATHTPFTKNFVGDKLSPYNHGSKINSGGSILTDSNKLESKDIDTDADIEQLSKLSLQVCQEQNDNLQEEQQKKQKLIEKCIQEYQQLKKEKQSSLEDRKIQGDQLLNNLETLRSVYSDPEMLLKIDNMIQVAIDIINGHNETIKCSECQGDHPTEKCDRCWLCSDPHRQKDCPIECQLCGKPGHPVFKCPNMCKECGKIHKPGQCLTECSKCKLYHEEVICPYACKLCDNVHTDLDCPQRCLRGYCKDRVMKDPPHLPSDHKCGECGRTKIWVEHKDSDFRYNMYNYLCPIGIEFLKIPRRNMDTKNPTIRELSKHFFEIDTVYTD